MVLITTTDGTTGRPRGKRTCHVGTRMAADEFLQILDDGNNYELFDGVVRMSPSPTPKHQRVSMEIAGQLWAYLRENPVGAVFSEIDVHLGQGPGGGDLVYKPEIVFLRTRRLRGLEDKIVGAPDLVVEVISRGSRRLDSLTKKRDYESAGVHEYWLVDPDRERISFFRLVQRRYVLIRPGRSTFVSEAVPGFVLDLVGVRDAFRPW